MPNIHEWSQIRSKQRFLGLGTIQQTKWNQGLPWMLKLRHKRDEFKTGWPSGLRRWIKAPISSGAWVRIPLQSNTFIFRYSMKNSDLLSIRPPVETKILQELNSARSDLGDYLISKMKHLTKTSDLTKLWKKNWKFRQSENEISTIIDQSQSNIRSRDGKYIFVYLHPKTDSDSRSNF